MMRKTRQFRSVSSGRRLGVLGLAFLMLTAACGGQSGRSGPAAPADPAGGQVEKATLRLETAWPETDKY